MCMAALWQMYVMMTETYTLNRFKDKELVWRVALLFISFSLAVYLLCPNSRKRHRLFILGEAVQPCIRWRGWVAFQQVKRRFSDRRKVV